MNAIKHFEHVWRSRLTANKNDPIVDHGQFEAVLRPAQVPLKQLIAALNARGVPMDQQRELCLFSVHHKEEL